MNQTDDFRLPILSAGLALGWGLGSVWLYQQAQLGLGIASPAAIFAGCLAVANIVRAINDQQKLRAYRSKRKNFNHAARHHGQARWGDLMDLKREKLVGGGDRGIFLGTFQGHDVWYDGQNSGNIFGPPGSGKSTSVFLPTLLVASARTDEERQTASSFIINDTSAELYAVSHQALRNAGYDVVVQSSWADEISTLIGEKVTDAGLNIFSSYNPRRWPETIRDEIKFRIKLLVPNEKPGTSEESKFFNRGGRRVLEWDCLSEYASGRTPNLGAMQQRLLASPGQLHERLVGSMESSAFGGYLASLASGLAGQMSGAPETFAGYMGVVQGALEPYDAFSAVGKHVSGPGFDISRIKGDKPVAIFLIYPARRIVTHHAMLNAEVTYLLEMICADPRRRWVTALLDEASGMGHVPELCRFLEEGRKHHLRTFLGWQALNQTDKHYDKIGRQQILAACHVLWASGIREPEFRDMLCKDLGIAAIEGGDMSINDRSRPSQIMPDQSYGMSNKGVPLMRDVRTELGPEEALLLYRNMPPCRLQKVPYFRRPEWAARAATNPYVG